MKPLKRFAFAVALLLVYLAASAQSSAATTLPNASAGPWFHGAAGYARAVELQRQLNVPLVVYFYTDWCGYCRALDNKYLPSAPVQEYLQGVVKVRINPEHGKAERALSQRYGISGYPSFFVIRQAETRPVNVHPFRRAGNLTPKEFANACRAVAPISKKTAPVRGSRSGVSRKFRERSEVVTNVSSTRGGGKIVTVVSPALPKKGSGRKQ
jgi:thiol-disulfide isomerase/thioredoxin